MVFNARSLRNKTFGVCEFLKDKGCDVCFITEAWLKLKDESIIAEIHDLGFDIKFQPRKGSRRGGGVCVLFKHGIGIEKCSIKSYKSFEVIQTTIKSSLSLLRVSTFYRTGRISPLVRINFSTDLDNYLESLLHLQGENILCGDFNIHVEDKSSLNTNALFSVTESYGYKQLVNGSTHLDGGTLDLLFVQQEGGNCRQLVEKSLYIYDQCHSLTSDHKFIECLIPFAKDDPLPSNVEKSFRNYKDIELKQFCMDIESRLLSLSFFTFDVNAAVKVFNEVLVEVLDQHAPIVTKSFSIKKTDFTNPKILSARRTRRRYERKYRKFKHPTDLMMYRKALNNVHKYVKQARNDWCRNKLSESEGNNKQTFKVLNDILGKKTKQALPDHLSEENLCNEFSEFFKDKICSIRDDIDMDQRSSSQFLNQPSLTFVQSKNVVTRSFSKFIPMSEGDLTNIMKELSNKHCELDIIPTYIFKACVPFLMPFLLHIINSSLISGIFPTEFKKAIVRPTLKSNNPDRNILSSYRPVSNLCFFSKVIEKCVLHQLLQHLDRNDLFGNFQSAYRKFHSCETAITKVSNDILNTLDKSNNVFLIFLDLSSAFDLVDHPILLKRLSEQFHINDTVLHWFMSYLKDRSYSVKIGCSISNGVITLYGVPQGSILGPILFLLYVWEIENIAKLYGLEIHMFADDLQLYISFVNTNIYDNITTIEHCLRHIKLWMSNNFLKINEGKTQLLIVSPKNSTNSMFSDLCVSFGGSTIFPSTNARNLGVNFDSSMSFLSHINDITSKGYYYLNNFYRVADKLTFTLKVQMITTYIIPLIDYCNVIFTAATQLAVNKLQKLLNTAVRFVFNLNGKRRRLSITPYLKKLHILPVNYRIKYKLCLLIYKCIQGCAPKYICDLITQKVSFSKLRSSNDLLSLHIDVPRSTYGEHAFSYIAPVHWNTLPLDLRLTSSLDDFKKRLKTYFFRQCYE